MIFVIEVDNDGFKVYDSGGTLIDPATEGTLDDVKSILTAVRDTAGIKKITDALPVGTNWLGKVQLGNGTNVVEVTNDGGVYRLEIYGKIRRADGTVINPATEETLAAADTKLGTIDAVLDSIKDTAGIKKITDALPAGDNAIGRIRIIDSANSKIVTVIDDATTPANKRFLVETDFKPGAILNVIDGASSEDPAAEIKERLENGGSDAMNVDGSSTPVEFVVNADATDDIRLSSLRFVMVANTLKVTPGNFGPFSDLTNGVKVEVRANNVTTQIALLKETTDFLDFHGPTTQPFDRSGTSDLMVIQHNFGGTKLIAGSGDFVKVTIQDDLDGAQLSTFFSSIAGVKV